MEQQRQQPNNTPSDANGWTFNTLYKHFLSIVNDLKTDQQHRHEANQSAIEKAFTAQETAMQTAFTSQAQAIDKAFTAQAAAVAAALAAAKEAGTKSEGYSEKRFDLVAEKIDQNLQALTIKIESNQKELSDKIGLLATASTTQASQKVGLQGGWTTLVGAIVVLGILVDIVFRLIGH